MPGDIKHPSWSTHLMRIKMRIQDFFSLSQRPCNECIRGIDNLTFSTFSS